MRVCFRLPPTYTCEGGGQGVRLTMECLCVLASGHPLCMWLCVCVCVCVCVCARAHVCVCPITGRMGAGPCASLSRSNSPAHTTMHLFVLRIIRSKNGAIAEHRHDVPSAPPHAQNMRRQTRTKRGGDDIELRLGNSMHFCPKGKAQQVHIDVSWCRRDERHLFAHWAGLILHAGHHPPTKTQTREKGLRTHTSRRVFEAGVCV